MQEFTTQILGLMTRLIRKVLKLSEEITVFLSDKYYKMCYKQYLHKEIKKKQLDIFKIQ